MALAAALLNLLLLVLFCLAFCCLGNLILRFLHLQLDREADHLLVAIALGIVATEILLFFVQFSQHLRSGSFATAALLFLLLPLELRSVLRRARNAFAFFDTASASQKALNFAIFAVIAVEFLMSCAPLTGSDAQDYHFNAQKLYLLHGFHPVFSNIHTFLCGQHHSLILFGLALGSERLALGFIFLAGILSAAALACLASRWASPPWPDLVTLVFLVTPLVFWQVSSSGSPDIFMAFFLSAALLMSGSVRGAPTWQHSLVLGILAGAVAGAKYTGVLIALPVAFSFILEFRSLSATAVFALGAFLSGAWIYIRNLIWFGNPVFPFLASRFSPHLVTSFALHDLSVAVGEGQQHTLSGLLAFLLFAASRQGSTPGLYEFFGPTVLLLSPLALLAFKNTRVWRSSFLIWILSGLAIFLTSGLPRFMFPLYPMALATVAAAMELIQHKQWRYVRFASLALFVFVCLSGFAGLAIYGAKPIQAAIGAKRPQVYLQETAQDYNVVAAINRLFADTPSPGNILVFIRHTYYLQVPYINGDPANSFEIDPTVMTTPESWREYLRARHISYVIRGADYPRSIAAPLHELEQCGDLRPFAEIETRNLTGMRIDQVGATARLVALKVNF